MALGAEQVVDRDQWVSSTCPFAQWTHDEQISHRNSFGISTGNPSYFNCFSCRKNGALTYLPTLLSYYTKRDWVKLREFIFLHETTSTGEIEPYGETKKLPNHASATWLKDRFSVLSSYRNISSESIKTWHLRFDKRLNRVIIPIKDKFNRIVGIKGRSINPREELRYKLYDDLKNSDPKKYGIWFGMHLPLILKKGLVLVEGEIDCILLHQSRLVSNAWAVMGVGITDAQIATLAAVTLPLIFFFDNDKAGQDLKEMLHIKLRGLTQHYHVVNYFGCHDAGEAIEQDKLRTILSTVTKL